MLVLHRAKLLASNQSVLALGVAPSGVRAAAPHSAPARMPGVHAQRLCRTQSPKSVLIGIEKFHYSLKKQTFSTN